MAPAPPRPARPPPAGRVSLCSHSCQNRTFVLTVLLISFVWSTKPCVGCKHCRRRRTGKPVAYASQLSRPTQFPSRFQPLLDPMTDDSTWTPGNQVSGSGPGASGRVLLQEPGQAESLRRLGVVQLLRWPRWRTAHSWTPASFLSVLWAFLLCIYAFLINTRLSCSVKSCTKGCVGAAGLRQARKPSPLYHQSLSEIIITRIKRLHSKKGMLDS